MTSSSACRPLWADEGLRRVAGDTLRPGGLELTGHALALAGVRPGGRVLDVGCGLGTTVRHLRGLGYRAVGLDASPAQLALAPGGLPLAAAHAACPPFGPDRFEAVLCECVLSLLDDPGAALAALGRVLVPGGMLVVTDLCRRPGQSPRSSSVRLDGGRWAGCAQGAFDLDAFTTLVRRAGFEPMALENHDRLLKEFIARLILAGVGTNRCKPHGDDVVAVPLLGYFLLTACH